MSNYTFTSESVTEGHPDKMADQVSDAVLDAILAEDPNGRVACETLLTTGLCVVAGEITTDGVRRHPEAGPRGHQRHRLRQRAVRVRRQHLWRDRAIDEQSGDIAQGVDLSEEVRGGRSGEDLINSQGAGDQGMMFGYACDDTPDLMPLPIWLAHRMAEKLTDVRKAGAVPYLRPDGKTQVTFEYDSNGKPIRLVTALISTQHQDGVDRDTVIRPDLIEQVIRPVVPAQFADDDYDVYINPTGKFVIGGPHGDTGLTGRKIIVDTYGGMGRHGGGAFSGKDPSKVDRSAAYAAALGGQARRRVGCSLALRSAGGIRHRHGSADEHPRRDVRHQHRRQRQDRRCRSQVFDLRPAAIVRDLDLKRPIYRKTAAYGHFGRCAARVHVGGGQQARRLQERCRPVIL